MIVSVGVFDEWVCRWAHRGDGCSVLVCHCGDKRRSLGEVYRLPSGTIMWEILHPSTGAILERMTAASPGEARSAAERLVEAHSGEIVRRRSGRRGHTPARDVAVACVLRHPEGISAAGVAAEIGGSPGAASHALQVAHRRGLVRHTGSRSTARYWPPEGYEPPAASGASSPEPSPPFAAPAEEPSSEGSGASPAAGRERPSPPVSHGESGPTSATSRPVATEPDGDPASVPDRAAPPTGAGLRPRTVDEDPDRACGGVVTGEAARPAPSDGPGGPGLPSRTLEPAAAGPASGPVATAGQILARSPEARRLFHDLLDLLIDSFTKVVP